MPRRIVLTPDARADLMAALDWYAENAPSIVPHIRRAQRELFDRIAVNPMQFPVGAKNTRRAIMRRFPYVVVFVVTDDTAQIIAFFHTSRDPRQWRRRI